jgi:hypothetical protein
LELETKPARGEPNPRWGQSLRLSLDQHVPRHLDVQLRVLDALGSKCIGSAGINLKTLLNDSIGVNPAAVKTTYSLLMDATSAVLLSVSLEWTPADWRPGVLQLHSISIRDTSLGSDMLAHGVLHIQSGSKSFSLSPRPWYALAWNPVGLNFGFPTRPTEDMTVCLCCEDDDKESVATFSFNVPALVNTCAAGLGACVWQIELWNQAAMPSLVGSTMIDARQLRCEVLATRKRMVIHTFTLPPRHYLKQEATKAKFVQSCSSPSDAGAEHDGLQLTLCCATDVDAELEDSEHGELTVCEWTARWNGRPPGTSNLYIRLVTEDMQHQTAVAWDCTTPVWTEEWPLQIGPSQQRMLQVEHSLSNASAMAWLEWKPADEPIWAPGEFRIRVCRVSNLPNWLHARNVFMRAQLGDREQLSAPAVPATDIEFNEVVRFWLYEEPQSPLIIAIVAWGIDRKPSPMGFLEIDLPPCIRRCSRLGGAQEETRRMSSSEVIRSDSSLVFETSWTPAAEVPWDSGVLKVMMLFGGDNIVRCVFDGQDSSNLEQRSLARSPWVRCSLGPQSFSAPLRMRHRGDFDQEFHFTLDEPPKHDLFFEVIDKTLGMDHKCGSVRVSTPQLIAELHKQHRHERIELELKLNGVPTGTVHASFRWSHDSILLTCHHSAHQSRGSDARSNGSSATLPFTKLCKQIVAHGGLHIPQSMPRIPFADVLRRQVFGVKEVMKIAPALCASVSETAISVLRETSRILISASYTKNGCMYNDEVRMMFGVALDQLASPQLDAASRHETVAAAATVVSMISRPRGLFSAWPANHLREMRGKRRSDTGNSCGDEGPFLCIRHSMLQRLCVSLEHLLAVLRAHFGKLFKRHVRTPAGPRTQTDAALAVELQVRETFADADANEQFMRSIELGVCAITDALASLSSFSDSCRMLCDLKLVGLLNVIQNLLSLPKLRGRTPWAKPAQLHSKWTMLTISESAALCSLNVHANDTTAFDPEGNPGPVPLGVRSLALSAMHSAHERACRLISSQQFDLALFNMNVAFSLTPADYKQRHSLLATRAAASIGTGDVSSALEDVLAGMELSPKDQTLLDIWSFLHPSRSNGPTAPDPTFVQECSAPGPTNIPDSTVPAPDLESRWQQIAPCTNEVLLRHNLSDSGKVSIVTFAADDIARSGVEIELRNKPITARYLVHAAVAKTLERVKAL